MPTPKLSLPYIATGQAQKELTHNDALNDLDALVQLRVLDRDLATPPTSPANGDAYIVAAAATGLWAGRDGQLAFYYSGWRFKIPLSGWRAYVVDEGLPLEFDGTNWVTAAGGGGGLASLGSVSAPGLSFTADSDTGFYSDGSNSLCLVTAATERLRVGPAGNLSIGTTSAPSSNAQTLLASATHSAPYLQIGEVMQAAYIGSSYDSSTLAGTSYLGFNAARGASNSWTFDGDGTSNGGGVIDHAKNGGMRFFTRISSGGTATTLTDSGLNTGLRLLVHSSYVCLGGSTGGESLRAVRVSSQVNRIDASGNVTGAAPSLSASGSDTNIDLAFNPKGTGRIAINVNSANTPTTVGAAGGATALPATPVAYLRVTINGTVRKIPYYLD